MNRWKYKAGDFVRFKYCDNILDGTIKSCIEITIGEPIYRIALNGQSEDNLLLIFPHEIIICLQNTASKQSQKKN